MWGMEHDNSSWAFGAKRVSCCCNFRDRPHQNDVIIAVAIVIASVVTALTLG